MKKIKLTQGKYAIVDDEDFEWLNQWKWCYCKYVIRDIILNKKNKRIYMHRLIMNTPEKMQTDHINGNKLDNRRNNLRICTQSQNNMNRKISKLNTSGYRGIYWDKDNKNMLKNLLFYFVITFSFLFIFNQLAGRAIAGDSRQLQATESIRDDALLAQNPEELDLNLCGLDSVVCAEAGESAIPPKAGSPAWAIITAYTSDPNQTDSTPEIAANGQNIWHLYQKGFNTCASNNYKFGTKIKIDDLGICIVRDRMNRRYTGKNKIDWYMGYSTQKALRFGEQKLQIIIL